MRNNFLSDEFFYEVWDYVSEVLVGDIFFYKHLDYLKEITYVIFDYQSKNNSFDQRAAARLIEKFLMASKDSGIDFDSKSIKLEIVKTLTAYTDIKYLSSNNVVDERLTEIFLTNFLSLSQKFRVNFYLEDPNYKPYSAY